MKTPFLDRTPFLVLLLVLGIVSQQSTGAIDLEVYNNNDNGAGSLRQAIASNAALGGGNNIVFSAFVSGTITLLSELLINNDVTIIGPGYNVLTLSGNNANREFHIANNATVSISGLTVAYGSAATDGGGILQDSGSLVLSGCVISGNAVSGYGGGIEAHGSLTASNCTFSGNTCEITGGAIYQPGGALTLDRCTFYQNTTGFAGGGAIRYAGSQGTIRSCTFASNHATSGGGLYNDGTVTVTNCTFSANSSGTGGGIFNSGSATLRNTLIAGNTAGNNGPDCSGTFISGGFNLIGESDGSTGWGALGDQVGTINSPINPLLGPLKDNGGHTWTMAPLPPNSPVIDQGESSGFTSDQRGAPRPFDFPNVPNAPGGDGSDIGAFELGRPFMGMRRLTNHVVLSWAAYYGDFKLQFVSDLAPSSNWSTVPGTPIMVGNQFNVTDGPATGTRFYRLALP